MKLNSRILILAAVLLLPLLVQAQQIGRIFDVKALGATGDGRTLDTDAINRTIEAAAAAGGGTVLFPAGTYASYSIHLRSHIALYLDAGATILAADPPPEGQPGGYDAPEPNEWNKYQDFGHCHFHNSLIWGENLENIAILGPGRIFGKGLSRGGVDRKDPLPGEPPLPKPPRTPDDKPWHESGSYRNEDRPFGYPSPADTLPAGVGNKAIALKNCRNVIMRDFTIFHGGHFAILATGVDNWTCDNLKIDTNRDGIDFDSCKNVRVSNCYVNSPRDDGICPKSSFALGYNRATENVTITNCQVSGYDEGTLLDGTYKKTNKFPTGRIKLGTEANGGFKNITISNCVFDYSRGIALEEVDGGWMEDITITNITMRDIFTAPIFIRLGARLRAPGTPPVGEARRIIISNIVAHNVVGDQGILIAGLPGHPVKDITLSNIYIGFVGGGKAENAKREIPEMERDYPEPSRFGALPGYGLFARHVEGLTVRDLTFRVEKEDRRPPLFLQGVRDVFVDRIDFDPAAGVPAATLSEVENLTLLNCSGIPDARRKEKIANESL